MAAFSPFVESTLLEEAIESAGSLALLSIYDTSQHLKRLQQLSDSIPGGLGFEPGIGDRPERGGCSQCWRSSCAEGRQLLRSRSREQRQRGSRPADTFHLHTLAMLTADATTMPRLHCQD